MTYRERRERRAERLREWADGREAKSDAAHEASRDATAGIPFGQPILVGHHSERRHRNAVERGQRQATAAIEHGRTADRHREKADNIERAAANAIYSDDDDADERLREKIETLEAKRSRIKAYNASCRKAAKSGGIGDLSLLSEAEQQEVATLARVAAYQLGDGAALPSYQLSNLGATIRTARKRLEAIEAGTTRAQTDRVIEARYDGTCADCGATINRGDTIRYSRANGARCEQCTGEGG
jgi:hypothetical protein